MTTERFISDKSARMKELAKARYECALAQVREKLNNPQLKIMEYVCTTGLADKLYRQLQSEGFNVDWDLAKLKLGWKRLRIDLWEIDQIDSR